MQRLKEAGNTKDANELFFHSFVGSIIYGHGELNGVTKLISKIVGLLSDTLFMVICSKLLLVLTCLPYPDDPSKQYLQMKISGSPVTCWEGEHRLLACLSLIAFGFYLPLSAMIAPMLMEADEDAAKHRDEKAEAAAKLEKEKAERKLKQIADDPSAKLFAMSLSPKQEAEKRKADETE